MSGKAAKDAGEDWVEPTAEERAWASLDMAAPAGAPPADLWAKIEQRLAAAEPIAIPSDLDIERYAQGPWRKAYAGVRMKRLWGRHMFLLDCDAGATVPAHTHTMVEHTLILSGDVQADDTAYGAGDYFRMPAGSQHAAWGTKAGCRVLIHYEAV